MRDPSDLEDIAKVKDCLDGNVQAFEFLFDKYREKVYRLALRFVRNKEDALEVTQAVFLRVYLGIKKFKTDSKFFTWLYRIASNLVIDDANSLQDIFVRDRTGWTYAVAGTVRDGVGNPVSGINVGYGSKIGENDVTDSNGEYELYYMPTGEYHIRVRTSGWLSIPGERVVSVPPTTIDADFELVLASHFIYLPSIMK